MDSPFDAREVRIQYCSTLRSISSKRDRVKRTTVMLFYDQRHQQIHVYSRTKMDKSTRIFIFQPLRACFVRRICARKEKKIHFISVV